MKELNDITVLEAHDLFQKKIDTIYNAIENKRLKAYWHIDGKLRVTHKDMEECFVKPPFPEFVPLELLSFLEGLCLQELKMDIKNKKLEARKVQREWYIHNEEWMRYKKERFDHCKVIDRTQMADGEFTVLNSRGIHKRPAYFFCGIAMEYPNNVITLTYKDKAWEYEGPSSMGELLEKDIQQGEEVEVRVSGDGAKELLAIILKTAANKFAVDE